MATREGAGERRRPGCALVGRAGGGRVWCRRGWPSPAWVFEQGMGRAGLGNVTRSYFCPSLAFSCRFMILI